MLKLVNVVQVMLIRRILPCQQRAFNLWEFDPVRHQTLSRLFDTTYEDAWKVLFKGAEAPRPLPRIADSVHSISSCGKLFIYFYRVLVFHSLTPCGI